MRVILTIAFILATVVCESKVKSPDSLYIRFFMWDNPDAPHITTCDNFEYDVPYKEILVNNPADVELLYNRLQQLGKISDTDFNVGCKLFFIKNNKLINEICMNEHYVLMDGLTYKCERDVKTLIDKFMLSIDCIHNEFKYKPDKYGNEYPQVREALYKKMHTFLSNTLKKLDASGSISVVVHCKCDHKGKNESAIVTMHSNDIDGKVMVKLEKEFEHWLMHKVRWKRNKLRMKSDWIEIYYRYK